MCLLATGDGPLLSPFSSDGTLLGRNSSERGAVLLSCIISETEDSNLSRLHEGASTTVPRNRFDSMHVFAISR